MTDKEFTVRELAEDPSFRRMVKGMATPEEIEKWNRWIESGDENRAKAKAAVSQVAGFEFKAPDMPDVEQQWSKLYGKTIGKQQKGGIQHPRTTGRKDNEGRLRWIYRAVAVFLIVGLAGAGGFYFSDGNETVTHLKQLTEEKTITTSEGEQKTLTFSNGSKVILNSSSTLTYNLGLLHNQTIDVRLEGEAWFNAENDPSSEYPAFSVRTPDGIIRDIGTKFLVTVQIEQSRVVLQEGMVEVETTQTNGKNLKTEKEVFRVGTGEMVEFSRTDVLRREKVNPTFFTSWATGFMQLDETRLEDFAQYVAGRFDVQVKLNDSNLADITLDGTVYFRSLDELVRSVSDVIGIPVYRSADRKIVYIGNPE